MDLQTGVCKGWQGYATYYEIKYEIHYAIFQNGIQLNTKFQKWDPVKYEIQKCQSIKYVDSRNHIVRVYSHSCTPADSCLFQN